MQNLKPSSVAPSYGNSKNMVGGVSNENYNYNYSSSSANSNYNSGSGFKNTFDAPKPSYNNYNDGYTSGFSYTTNAYGTAGGAGNSGPTGSNGGFNSYSNNFMNNMSGKGTGFSPENNFKNNDSQSY